MSSFSSSQSAGGSFLSIPNKTNSLPLTTATTTTNAMKKIFLMGSHRNGKTSIRKVVFEKFMPHQTPYLAETTELEVTLVINNSLIQFEIWDFPSDFDFRLDTLTLHGNQLVEEQVFKDCGSIIFVLDAQHDVPQEVIMNMRETMSLARKFNPQVNLEIFVHKVDGDLFVSDFHKFNVRSVIQELILREFEDSSQVDIFDSISYFLTSIYDHSIYEALSKVIQKLVPQQGAMENLLNMFMTACDVEKVFIFDVVSKLYIATDHNAIDMQTYQLCSDMVELVLDVSYLYGIQTTPPLLNGQQQQQQVNMSIQASPVFTATSSLTTATTGGASSSLPHEEMELKRRAQFDKKSASVVRLSDKMVLYLKYIGHLLAVVCLARTPQFEKRGLIDFNIDVLMRSINEMFIQENHNEKS